MNDRDMALVMVVFELLGKPCDPREIEREYEKIRKKMQRQVEIRPATIVRRSKRDD